MKPTTHLRRAALRAFAALLATGSLILEAHPGHLEHAALPADAPSSGTCLLLCTAVALLAAGAQRLLSARTGTGR